jgi:cell division septation protein DedD
MHNSEDNMKHTHRHHHSKQKSEKHATKERLIMQDQLDLKTKMAEIKTEEEKSEPAKESTAHTNPSEKPVTPPSTMIQPAVIVPAFKSEKKQKNWLDKLKDKVHQLVDHI